MSSLAGGQPWPSGAVQSAKAVLHRTSKEGCWPPNVSDFHPMLTQEQGKGLVCRSGGEVRSCSHPAEAQGKLHDYGRAETFRPKSDISLFSHSCRCGLQQHCCRVTSPRNLSTSPLLCPTLKPQLLGMARRALSAGTAFCSLETFHKH